MAVLIDARILSDGAIRELLEPAEALTAKRAPPTDETPVKPVTRIAALESNDHDTQGLTAGVLLRVDRLTAGHPPRAATQRGRTT